jgi:hypothetical protein
MENNFYKIENELDNNLTHYIDLDRIVHIDNDIEYVEKILDFWILFHIKDTKLKEQQYNLSDYVLEYNDLRRKFKRYFYINIKDFHKNLVDNNLLLLKFIKYDVGEGYVYVVKTNINNNYLYILFVYSFDSRSLYKNIYLHVYYSKDIKKIYEQL